MCRRERLRSHQVNGTQNNRGSVAQTCLISAAGIEQTALGANLERSDRLILTDLPSCANLDAIMSKYEIRPGSVELTRSQLAALDHITQYARHRKSGAGKAIDEVLYMSGIASETLEAAVGKIKSHAMVALHFHPDRPDREMKTVAEALLEQGIYKSQFETSLSSGGLTAYPGGQRDIWEKDSFGGAYHLEDSTDSQRPKYGALNLMLHPDGPSPRFGSCYFLLSPDVSSRCTFSYMDSSVEPKERGTYEEFDDILASLLKDAFFRESALGENNLTPRKLIDHLLVSLEPPILDPAESEPSRNLNHYIEAQVHGDVSLERDVRALVADPSFKGTRIGCTLEQVCLLYGINLYWHMGFALPVSEVPVDFRGASMPSLAARIASDGLVEANRIGDAAGDLKRDPASWSNRGTYGEVLQELKYLWHVLVRFGKPHRFFQR